MQVIEQQVDELGEAGVLDRLEVLHQTQRRAEAEVLQLAVQFAVLHDEHTLDPFSVGLDGREKAVRYGGSGTPLVTEFCCADFGSRLQLSPWAAQRLIGDALDLKHRLPQLWRRVQALEVKVSYARHVARRTRDLEPEQAGYVDSRVVESADGRITWTRFEQLVEAAIVGADPEAAAAREQKAATDAFARATRSTEHGMRGFYVRAHFAIIARLDATVAYLAEALRALGEDTSEDQRRALACWCSPTRTRRCGSSRPTTSKRRAPRPTLSRPRLRLRPLPRPGGGRTSATCCPTSPSTSTPIAAPSPPPAWSASRTSARSPRPGSGRSSVHTPGSGSSPSSTSRARRPSTATRSQTDIDGPCI